MKLARSVVLPAVASIAFLLVGVTQPAVAQLDEILSEEEQELLKTTGEFAESIWNAVSWDSLYFYLGYEQNTQEPQNIFEFENRPDIFFNEEEEFETGRFVMQLAPHTAGAHLGLRFTYSGEGIEGTLEESSLYSDMGGELRGVNLTYEQKNQFDVLVLMYASFTDKFHPFLMVGPSMHVYEISTKGCHYLGRRNGCMTIDEDDSALTFGYKYGGGLVYNITENFAIQALWEVSKSFQSFGYEYKFDDDTHKLGSIEPESKAMSLGLLYSFD